MGCNKNIAVIISNTRLHLSLQAQDLYIYMTRLRGLPEPLSSSQNTPPATGDQRGQYRTDPGFSQ